MILKCAMPLSKLPKICPDNEIWINYTCDLFGVTEFVFDEIKITDDCFGWWLKSKNHNGVKRELLDFCLVFKKP